MLYRMVRPVSRKGSRFGYYFKRIPVDVKDRAAGLKLDIRVGDKTTVIAITAKTQMVRVSLRTNDPALVKKRQAEVDAYLDAVWRSLRQDAPINLDHEQVVALSGRLYRAWANGARGERITAVEQGADGSWRTVQHDPRDDEVQLEASLQRLIRPATIGTHEMDKPKPQRRPFDLDNPPPADEAPEPSDLETTLGPIVDRVLQAEGISTVDDMSRGLLLVEFWRALRDALESRLRNVKASNYSPDPKAKRFPVLTSPRTTSSTALPKALSLTSLFDGWWGEAQKVQGLSKSTHDSYKATIKNLSKLLEHDDATRVTEDDIIAFKDHRLATPHPRKKGQTLSGRTVKDSDLAALKSIFGWAKDNRKLQIDPAKNVRMRRPRRTKVRDKWFLEPEWKSVLTAALTVERGPMTLAETHAAKRWVPWLMAYSGARVGEMVQLRKQDLQREGNLWVITITPEAGTVKTKEARKVVLHDHLIEQGFVEFVNSAPSDYLFVRPAKDGNVLGPLKGVKNKLQDFVRKAVKDRNIKPNHAWRDTFKKIGLEAGMDRVVVYYIAGWTPTTVSDKEYPAETPRIQANELAKFPRYVV